MGLLDWFTGNKSADSNIAPIASDKLKQAILQLNRAELPWEVCAGAEGKVDLVARWKLEDPYWREELAKALMSDGLQMLMRLDEKTRTVRAVDQAVCIEWIAGVAHVSLSIHGFRGQENEVGRSFVFGRKPDGTFGTLEAKRFSTSDFKQPIRQIVAASGWSWHGVILAKL